MGKYVDGFLLPIAKDKIGEYMELARQAGEIWKEHGALEYRESVGDDLDTGDMVSFKSSSNAASEETVIFAWIVYESKDARDKINADVMADVRMKQAMEEHKGVFDFKRMAYGGFEIKVDV
jgi:uncharacterized protein YbaA (DUF1428 family)